MRIGVHYTSSQLQSTERVMVTSSKSNSRVAVKYSSAGTVESTNASGRIAVGYTASGNSLASSASSTGSTLDAQA